MTEATSTPKQQVEKLLRGLAAQFPKSDSEPATERPPRLGHPTTLALVAALLLTPACAAVVADAALRNNHASALHPEPAPSGFGLRLN